MKPYMVLAALACSVLLVLPFSVCGQTLLYDSTSDILSELAIGRWALLFLAGDSASYTSTIDWFGRASDAFTEIRFLVVASGDSLVGLVDVIDSRLSGSVSVLADPQSQLADSLELTTYPACFISVDGVFVRELIWPFSEARLLRSLAESLLVEVVFPDPTTLVGSLAPTFNYEDSDGLRHSSADMPLPLLLVFINPDCYPCLDVLPLGPDIPRFLSIAIILAATQASIDETQLQRLTALRQDLGAERTAIAFTSRNTLVAYSIARSPTLVLVSTTGTIVWIADGVLDRKMVTDELQVAIAAMDNSPRR